MRPFDEIERDETILAMAEAAELRAQLDDARKALQARRPRALRIRGELPAWQKWIIYPIGAAILWDCLRVVFLGGQIR